MKQETKNKLQRGVATGLLIPALGVVSAPKVAAVTAVLAYVITIVSCPNGTTDEVQSGFFQGIPVYKSGNVADGQILAAIATLDNMYDNELALGEQTGFKKNFNRINVGPSSTAISNSGKTLIIPHNAAWTDIYIYIYGKGLFSQLQLDNGVRLVQERFIQDVVAQIPQSKAAKQRDTHGVIHQIRQIQT